MTLVPKGLHGKTRRRRKQWRRKARRVPPQRTQQNWKSIWKGQGQQPLPKEVKSSRASMKESVHTVLVKAKVGFLPRLEAVL